MQSMKARVRNGRLVLDEPTELPEGEEVELVPLDEVLADDNQFTGQSASTAARARTAKDHGRRDPFWRGAMRHRRRASSRASTRAPTGLLPWEPSLIASSCTLHATTAELRARGASWREARASRHDAKGTDEARPNAEPHARK